MGPRKKEKEKKKKQYDFWFRKREQAYRSAQESNGAKSKGNTHPKLLHTIKAENTQNHILSFFLSPRGTSERDKRQLDVRRLVGVQTGGTGVVRAKGGDDAEGASGLGDRGASGEFAHAEEQEGDPEEEEHGRERDGGLVRGEEHDEGEREPGHEVDAQRAVQLVRVGISSEDTGARPEDQRERDPEAAIRAESSGTEGVTGSELPHASEELDETSDANGHADDEIGGGDASRADIEEGENQGGRSEGEQAERTRITEASVVDGETRLGDIDTSGSMGAADAEGVAGDMVNVASEVAVGSLLVYNGGHDECSVKGRVERGGRKSSEDMARVL